MNSISFIAQTVDRAFNNESTNPSQIIPKESIGQIDSNTSASKVSANDEKIDQETESIVSKDDIQQDESKSTASSPVTPENTSINREGTISFMIRIFLFIPNLIIVRPLLFSWFIITFPLNLLERKKSNTNNDNNEDNDTTNTEKDNKDQPQSDSEPASSTPSPSLSPTQHSQHSNTTIPELDEETESLLTDSKIAIDLKSPTSPISSSLSILNSKLLTFPKICLSKKSNKFKYKENINIRS
ncbi:unnamed protein product [Wickerhamomyces anomalus]